MARRNRRRADLDNPFWWVGALIIFCFWCLAAVVLLAAGLVQAVVVLPVAGIAALSHNKPLAQKMVRSLAWYWHLPRRSR